MPVKVAIIDYKMGNLFSVFKKLRQINASPFVTAIGKEIKAADKIILPGVGHFGKAMVNLNELNLVESLHEAVLVDKKPLLGICLGMQLMAKSSEEGNATGLGWFNGKVIRFKIADDINYKIPQTGWNTIKIRKNSRLLNGLSEESEFYFLHAFHLKADNEEPVICTTEFEYEFVSGIEQDNLFGVQFHPEKSHKDGEELLKNFLAI